MQVNARRPSPFIFVVLDWKNNAHVFYPSVVRMLWILACHSTHARGSIYAGFRCGSRLTLFAGGCGANGAADQVLRRSSGSRNKGTTQIRRHLCALSACKWFVLGYTSSPKRNPQGG